MRILFSGGGTGGHIYPALAIRDILLKNSPKHKTGYVGVSGGMEENIVSRVSDCPFLPIKAQGMPRGPSWKWLTFPMKNVIGFSQAFAHVRKFKPKLVITTGGFVAFPVLMVARILKIPFIIHEQNAVMGITNRLFAGSAFRVLLTMPIPGWQPSERVVITGNPIRAELKESKSPNSRAKTGEFCVLVVGGSRGARTINSAFVDLSDNWLTRRDDVRVIHIVGERDFNEIREKIPDERKRHVLLPYLHEMKTAFDVADLIVSRAGATILAEIAHCEIPAILVPFPFATDNHQEKNARHLENLGAAKVILDKDLSWQTLANTIDGLRESDGISKMASIMGTSAPKDVDQRIFRALEPILEEN